MLSWDGTLGMGKWFVCAPCCVTWSATHPEVDVGELLSMLAIERVAMRTTIVAFCDVLADFAVTVTVGTRRARTVGLTQ